MYKVTINGVEKEVSANGMTVDGGTLIFYCNPEQTQSRLIVAAGKWDSLEVMEESNALHIEKTKKLPEVQEAPSGEAIRQALEEIQAQTSDSDVKVEEA